MLPMPIKGRRVSLLLPVTMAGVFMLRSAGAVLIPRVVGPLFIQSRALGVMGRYIHVCAAPYRLCARQGIKLAPQQLQARSGDVNCAMRSTCS